MGNPEVQTAPNAGPRPAALTVQAANIPQELRDLCQWVLWRWEYQPDRNKSKPWTKPPYQINGRLASSTDLATWTLISAMMQTYI